MNGSGMPVTGIRPIVMPIFSNTWAVNMPATPTTRHVPKESLVRIAIYIQRNISAKNRQIIIVPPTNPRPSTIPAKMKSVCLSGTNLS